MAVTAADVAHWAKLPSVPSGTELDLLERTLAAVIVHITERYAVPDLVEDWDAAQEQALMMQTARIWRRRSTPEGLAAFGDSGVMRVFGLDADVEKLLTPRFTFS